MFRKKAALQHQKKINALLNPKSHVQKKYFSLMLVPSYSSGKTRSIRIPYVVFYVLTFSIITVSAVILGFYLRSNYFKQLAQDVNNSLGLAQEAYLELQENTASEQTRLIEDSNQIQSQLSDELQRNQVEKNQQKQAYQDSLEQLREQVDELERQLHELDETRQDTLDQLGAKAYIPPVRTLLNDMTQSQTMLLSTLNEVQIASDERSASDRVTERDLQDYFTMLSAKMEAQLSCFNDLKTFISKINPYIKNYPTRWPTYGVVSSTFGYRKNPMGGTGGEFHDGMDIRCATGTNVRATGGGTVDTAGWLNGYGYAVIINHGFGIQTVYGHNSQLLVSPGQRVERGDIIAKSGNTGRSSGPHVHYEVRINGTATNPSKFLLE